MLKQICIVTGQGEIKLKLQILLLLTFFVCGYLIFLGARPLIIPDEIRYAEIPREILETGDWVVPRLDGIRYFEKPIMGYWMTTVAMLIFGENNFGLRITPAICAGICVILLFILARKFGKKNLLPLVSSCILISSSLFFAVGCINILDMPLAMFLTLAFTMFFFGYNEISLKRKVFYLAIFGVAAGCAFLVKGFLAFILIFIVIVPFLLWEKDFKGLLTLPVIPLITAASVILPWALMIHFRENDFWNYFFWEEHVKRFLSEEAQHSNPFWYFIPVMIAGFVPWPTLFPAVFVGLKKIETREKLNRFALCWFIFSFLFFSLSRGKLCTYIIPCFPPASLLLGIGLLKFLETGKQKLISWAMILYFIIIVVLAISVLVYNFGGFPYPLFLENETWKWIILYIAIAWAGGFSLLALKSNNFIKSILLYTFSVLGPMICFHVIMPDTVKQRCAPGDFLIRHRDRVDKDSVIFSNHRLFSSVCWFYKRSDVYIFCGSNELTYGMEYKDSEGRGMDLRQFINFVRKKTTKTVFLILSVKEYFKSKDKLRAKLPAPVYEKIDGDFVFIQFKGTR